MSDRKKLSDLLHEQINCLEMVADVLHQEQTALLQRDAGRLEDICRLKLERLESLKEFTVQQRELSEAFPESDELAESRLRIAKLCRDCQQQNASNEILLGTQQRYVNDLLSLIRGGSAAKPGYGPAGRSLPVAYSQRPIATA